MQPTLCQSAPASRLPASSPSNPIPHPSPPRTPCSARLSWMAWSTQPISSQQLASWSSLPRKKLVNNALKCVSVSLRAPANGRNTSIRGSISLDLSKFIGAIRLQEWSIEANCVDAQHRETYSLFLAMHVATNHWLFSIAVSMI